MKPLRIYLADLTYTTLSIATDAFPLNIGFVAAYAKAKFGKDIELTLFKYVDDLDRALHDSPPDILGMSNYPWNFSLGLEFFKMVAQLAPNTLRVMGGPNISLDDAVRSEFILKHRDLIDVYVYLEGEQAFANIIQRCLDQRGDKAKIKAQPIDGCVHAVGPNQVLKGLMLERRKELDEIPSPYLSGVLDKFFDGKLSPMMETNRGCPFSCAFCHEGNYLISKVNHFSLERVKAELDYIAAKVPATVTNLMFADPNFAMYERDYEIVEHIEKIQQKQNWPKFIFASTGKNKKERIAKALRKLNGSMTMWMSVQSMDQDVLKAIKRENIKTSEMMALASVYQELGLPTLSEVIVGLPGDSYDRHINSIGQVVESGIDVVQTYTCMLLNGTDLSSKASREKYQIGSHFRVLPRDFAKLSNGAVAVEIEEVITSTSTMSFEDYQALRRLHLFVSVVYNGSGFGPLFKLMRQRKIPVINLLKALVEKIASAPEPVQAVFNSFSRLTREELWNSEQELRDYICRDNNYEKLLKEEMGTNLIQTHTAKTLKVMNHMVDYVFKVARENFKEAFGLDSDLEPIFNSIQKYCSGRTHNIWGNNRAQDNPVFALEYDIAGWMRAGVDADLQDYRLKLQTKYEFTFPESKQKEMSSLVERFGTTDSGIGKILTKMNITRTWRDSVRVDQ